MGRKSQEVNPESGKRLKLWLNRMGISAKALCEAINYTPQYISDVITGKKRLTPDLAETISNVSGSFIHTKTGESFSLNILNRVRQDYLLLRDSFMTEDDRIHTHTDEKNKREDLIIQLLSLHSYEIQDISTTSPVKVDENGNEFQEATFALISPRGSLRVFSSTQLLEFIKKLDDSIEMQCAFQFRRVIDSTKNIYDWEV